MLTKDIVKGTEVYLRNGLRAQTVDNVRNQATRLMMVFGAEQGMFDEMGSVYTTDIVKANVDGVWVDVELTAKQREQMANRAAFGF